MTSLAELEAALAVTWDVALLAVFADALQAAGDPRGELISLDLHAAVHGATPEHAAHKREVQIAWLGEFGTYIGVGVEYGFLTLSLDRRHDPSVLDRALRHPHIRTLRTLSIVGESSQLVGHAAVLGKQVHPWLQRISIHRLDPGWDAAAEGAPSKRVVAATPVLVDLALRGPPVFSVFAHPKVQRLTLDNYFALGPFGIKGVDRAMPSLVEARIGPGPGHWSPVELDKLFDANGAPALTRLDLSAELPTMTPETADPRRTVSALLASLRRLTIKRQLTHLRLPAIRAGYEYDELQLAVATMPKLVELRVPEPLPGPLQHELKVVVDPRP